ncbi:MAG: hypothetical protein IFNCLDLE_02692 [Ignavibacteriaceae bacterium]|nr:hypothetical protein [Ignavibacteriaceae bacterium]
MKYTQSAVGVTVAEAQSIASVLAGQLRVRIAEGKEWKYDYDYGRVSYRREDLFRLTQEDVIANLLHETGHAKYSKNPKYYEYPGIPREHQLGVRMVIDMLEDFRMEDTLRADYPYAIDYLPPYSFKTKWYFQRITEKYEEQAQANGQQPIVPKIIQYLNKAYSYISGEAVMVLGDDNEEVKKAIKETGEKLQDIRNTAKSTDEIVTRVSKDIYPLIKHLFDDTPPEQPQPQGKPQGGSGGEKPKGGEPKKEPGKGEEKEKDGSQGSGDGEPKVEPPKPEPDSRPKPQDGFDKSWQQEIVHGFKATMSDVPPSNKEPYDDMFPEVKPYINKTADKLRKVLTDKAFDKFEGKYKSGKKLNQRRMWKPKIGDYRVFQRRVEASKKDYEFALVVDQSGSMTGGKIRRAIQASMLFANVLNKLEIPYIIYGFNRYMFPYKTSNEKYDPKKGKEIARSMWDETYSRPGSKRGSGDNNDAEAIYQVKKMLEASKSTKKVMMVFTDGQPANSGNMGYKHNDLKREVKKAIQDGINVIGVGLQYDGLGHYYPHNIVVYDMDELPDETVKVVKKALAGQKMSSTKEGEFDEDEDYIPF